MDRERLSVIMYSGNYIPMSTLPPCTTAPRLPGEATATAGSKHIHPSGPLSISVPHIVFASASKVFAQRPGVSPRSLVAHTFSIGYGRPRAPLRRPVSDTLWAGI
jgi:hypothetical protein